MKTKAKVAFLFYFLSISTVIFGQKKLEYGVHLGIFSGINAEQYNHSTNSFEGTSSSYSFSSSMDVAPSILAGVSLAIPFNSKGWQFKTGLDVHSFKYTFSTSARSSFKFFATSTMVKNTVIQLPLGCSKRWGDFIVYVGSGLTLFKIKNITLPKEPTRVEIVHNQSVMNTLDNFKKFYPFYEISLGWCWKRSTIELGYRGVA
jgi:Outer membrane protein beta-barrel domain